MNNMACIGRKLSVLILTATIGLSVTAGMASAQTNTFPGSGDAGIGTTSPTAALDVASGGIRVTGPLGGGAIAADVTALDHQSWGARFISMGPDNSTPGNIVLHQTSANNTVYRDAVTIDSSGKMGIGTWPAGWAALDVDTTGNKSIQTMDTTYGGLLMGYQGSTIQARTTANGNSQALILQYYGGNVGIGTSSPSSKLDVNGDITVSGNINAKYQDLAEWVPAARPITAGTVVIQDPDGVNTVLASHEAYDTRVAGVVSATPGIILGEAGDGKVKVATTGRVKVRVDATRSPIRAGDLLSTSGKEGVAMKSEPIDLGGTKIHRPGTLIGKALEPLAEGEGEILVLLSLQ